MKTLEELRQEMDQAYIDSMGSECYAYSVATYLNAREAYYKALLEERHAKHSK
jgi:hypothetical protein